MTKFWTTEARERSDGKLAIWKYMPLAAAGFEAVEGCWHKPQWVCIAVKEKRR